MMRRTNSSNTAAPSWNPPPSYPRRRVSRGLEGRTQPPIVIPAKAGIQGRGTPLTEYEHLRELVQVAEPAHLCYSARMTIHTGVLPVCWTHETPAFAFWPLCSGSDSPHGIPSGTFAARLFPLPDTNGTEWDRFQRKKRARRPRSPRPTGKRRAPTQPGSQPSCSIQAAPRFNIPNHPAQGRPTLSYLKPSARTRCGSSMFRPSTITGALI